MRFQRPNQLQDGVSILGSDDDGFFHLQIALNALVNRSSTSSHSECSAGITDHFDRIVLADVSGMGFTLVLDDIKLLSSEAIAAASFFLPTMATKAPVFGDDLTSLKAGKNRYLMKFKRNTTFAVVDSICRELSGLAGPNRFIGVCNTPIKTVR